MEFTLDASAAFAGTGGAPFSLARPCIVFVHGAGMDHSVWALQARYFAHHGHAVLALDLPGHGLSAGPPLASLEELGAWVIGALDALEVEKASLVGHSMGAIVTLEAAAQAPEKVTALALLGCAAAFPIDPTLLEAAKAQDALAFELMSSWGHDRRVQMGGHQTPGLWMMGGSLRLLQRGAPGTLYADLRALNDYAGGTRTAERVRCPTILIRGENDVMTTRAAEKELALKIEHAKTVIVPCSGHLMMVERPDQTLDALRDFL